MAKRNNHVRSKMETVVIVRTINSVTDYLFRYSYWKSAKREYHSRLGKELNYHNPADLNEKLMWLTRYWRHPLKTKCADKYSVRHYLTQLGLSDILVPLIGVYDTPEEIDFSSLPDKFVLKCNHGCGFNIIVLDKSVVDKAFIVNQLAKWMKIDYSKVSYELHYKSIRRKIICEQLISDEAPVEYQFWCVNGTPDSILMCRKNFDGSYDSWSFSLEWQQLFERINESKCTESLKPKNLSAMIAYSKLLSKPFPFLRVDFYETHGRLYFAEMTFTPCANMLVNYKKEFIERLGNSLQLPQVRLY